MTEKPKPKETEEELGVLGKPIVEPIVLSDPAGRQLGAISLTDGVFIPRETPPEEPTEGVGWPD